MFMCVLSDQVTVFWTSPRVPGVAYEGKNSLPRVGEVPYLSGVPHFHVNRP